GLAHEEALQAVASEELGEQGEAVVLALELRELLRDLLALLELAFELGLFLSCALQGLVARLQLAFLRLDLALQLVGRAAHLRGERGALRFQLGLLLAQRFELIDGLLELLHAPFYIARDELVAFARPAEESAGVGRLDFHSPHLRKRPAGALDGFLEEPALG